MAIEAGSLESLIKESFPDATIELVDLLGDQDHYQLIITSKEFSGKSRIAQHQLVYKALGDKMGGELHALTIKTKILEEGN